MEAMSLVVLVILSVVSMVLAYMQSLLASKALQAMQGVILELHKARDRIAELEDEVCLMNKELHELIEEAEEASSESDGGIPDWELN
jgi:type II secretory pathway component PulJ